MESRPTKTSVSHSAGVSASGSSSGGVGYAVCGVMSGVIAIIILPPIFGVAGVMLGAAAMKKGERTIGMMALVLSIVFMILGMLLGGYMTLHPEFIDTESTTGTVIKSLMTL